MALWVIESPQKGKPCGHLVVCDDEAQAKRVLSAAIENGDTAVMCWDLVTGIKKK